MKRSIFLLSILILIFSSCTPSPSNSADENSQNIDTEALVEDILNGEDGLIVTWSEEESIASSSLSRSFSTASKIKASVSFEHYAGRGLKNGLDEIIFGGN